MEGYKFMFDEKNIVTVWSCPNYCYNSGNVASVMLVDEALRYDFKIFKEVREPTLKGYRKVRARVRVWAGRWARAPLGRYCEVCVSSVTRAWRRCGGAAGWWR
jgi:hypothetical protein